MKLGLQRISDNTKVIVDGDYFAQVDKDVYSSNNGMRRMSEVFRGMKFMEKLNFKQFTEVKLQTSLTECKNST